VDRLPGLNTIDNPGDIEVVLDVHDGKRSLCRGELVLWIGKGAMRVWNREQALDRTDLGEILFLRCA